MGDVQNFLGKPLIGELRSFKDIHTRHCTNLLSDEGLFQKLNTLTFDMGVLDSCHINRCFVILLYRLVRYCSSESNKKSRTY